MYQYNYGHIKQQNEKKWTKKVVTPILKFCRDFCLETNIHGFNHIAAKKRHWVERLLWVCVIGAAIWGATEICLGQLQRYNENPTVVTLEKDFRSWRFSLPGITACVTNRVNAERLPEVIKNIWNVDPQHEKYSYYSRFVETVANSDLFHLEKYQEFKDDKSLNVDLYKIAVDMMPELSVKVTWSEKDKPTWIPVMTESGGCYVTNSRAIADTAIGSYLENITEKYPMTCKYSSLSCYVILEITTPTNFYVHSPYDVVDITVPPSYAFPTLNRFTELSVMETRSGRGVRALKPHRRGCLYTDEPTQAGRQVYSTNSCRLSCRNRLAMKLCGCKPFYYSYEDGPTCNPAGMWCLAGHSQVLANIGGEKCACSQQCIDCVFREIYNDDQYWERGPFVLRGLVRFTVQVPRTRYTREIVFHFQDLVVSFGGAVGLFLGASFISFVEILYFIVEKILRICIKQAPGEPERKPTVTEDPDFETRRIMELSSILEDQEKLERNSFVPSSQYF